MQQTAIFQHQCPRLQRALNHRQQRGRRTGLFQKIKSPRLHRAHRHGDISLARQQDHRQIGVLFMGVGQQVKPVAPGHAHV